MGRILVVDSNFTYEGLVTDDGDFCFGDSLDVTSMSLGRTRKTTPGSLVRRGRTVSVETVRGDLGTTVRTVRVELRSGYGIVNKNFIRSVCFKFYSFTCFRYTVCPMVFRGFINLNPQAFQIFF